MYNSLPYKTKQFFWLAIKLSIVIGCCYFVYQKLVGNDNFRFSDFYQNLTKNNVLSLKNSIILFLFTFFNWILEITKWRNLASFVRKTSFYEATKQSLASLTTSLITPNRIGEYGAKALYFKKQHRKEIVGLNLVGNFYQMLITLIFGVIGFAFFYYNNDVTINFRRVLRLLFLGIILISAFFFGAKHFKYRGYGAEKARKFINRISFSLNVKTAFLSLFRYLIFSHQYYLLLLLFNVEISYFDAITAITSVYFIASIVPMLSLFDVVLKGTVAIWVFAHFDVKPILVLSITTLMWIFNFVIPAFIGSYFVLIFKPVSNK
ncbi:MULTISPECIES: lysylphosphatidylglycerol synthase domain-containing protein [Tenacibaculum]|uniref:lysylphosphatidylglycerol synthase domain-containing protein n=1 Tax=Tenacibaculum TaxID=104267 RepID=UPI001F0AD304|nr:MULTISPECIES: lysylphosphatidylglycerol synthase domain-containing protein [Tenacibaculum]MCH3880893.1 lysylphosphatidylglycerol synthase domain-containing protein [Tenacibaculum aquimarinum]MCH3884229.1 lysylphosphatidylglycerol synthase domain-containing protein [Tenacibaculum aquimarinum]MDO6599508.1 lysylphosphatidylglycerol synthase domain-containing protein [Tenacibaculum sp. 1_MG-2023]